jgi:hypothetical protein
MLDQAETLKTSTAMWKKQADLAAIWVPEWEELQQLLSAGAGVAALADVEQAAQGILDNRLLLDNSDHVPPLLKQAAQTLRSAVTAAHQAYAQRHAELLAELEATEAWKGITGQQRITIMGEERISSVPDLEVGSDEQLLSALQHTPVSSWNDKTAALTVPKRGPQSGEAARTRTQIRDAHQRHAAHGSGSEDLADGPRRNASGGVEERPANSRMKPKHAANSTLTYESDVQLFCRIILPVRFGGRVRGSPERGCLCACSAEPTLHFSP